MTAPQQHIVHQIWGLCPADADKNPPSDLHEASLSWQQPGVQYKRWNRTEIEQLLDSTPWRSTFDSLEHWVEQCDFARYVILYIFGGIYADMDTVCKKMPGPSSKLLVGIEANVTEDDRIRHNLARSFQLCQWTFVCNASNPVLLHVIKTIANNTSLSCSNVLNRTGPGVFTDAVLEARTRFPDAVGILGIEAFACGQAHSDSPPASDPRCGVVHMFAGSWKVPKMLRPVVKLLKML
jgi:mannosyltransferase OCH1-like enzyme